MMKAFDFDNGGTMPALGLGTWKADPGVVASVVRKAIGIGYRHFDCAPIYGNEAEIGAAINAAISAGEIRREELWITSKLWNSDHARADVAPALKRTLDDLGLEYLDLYLIHWPIAFKPGVIFPKDAQEYLSAEQAPLNQTWAGMEQATSSGMCRHIGVSNFSRNKIEKLLDTATIRPAVNQVESHPYLTQEDLFNWCHEQDIVLTAYSPLGSGDRAEAMKKADEPSLLKDPVILSIAEKHALSAGQVLIAWALNRGTSVIPKSSNPKRLRENFAAGEVSLGAAAMSEIDNLDRGYRFVDGTFFTGDNSPYSLDSLWG
jgi:alcohol dehydrogenase (NADP+)